ncbi:MAG: ribosome silencing factor [Spirochaetes bacterium]|nr:ribosome silencing factor [Spirochaetota bacterium]
MVKKRLSENEIMEIIKDCVKVLSGKKAMEITVMDLRKINSYLDYFIISTGNSHIHCVALAKEMQRYFKKLGYKDKLNPSLDTGWIVLDFNEIVIHIFTKETRNYYQLEKLWGDAEFLSF